MESVFGSQEVSQQFKANVERAQALAQSRRAGLSYVEIVRIIVSGLPGDAQSAGDDFISIIEHAAREGFLRVEGVSITPSGNPIPFPENIHFPTDFIGSAGHDRIWFQVGSEERKLYCDLLIMFELLCAPILAILIIMRARAGRITPWMDIFWFIVMCFTAFAAMIFQGFRNLVCGTTPPVIEWKRGELPRLLDTRGGGWAQ